MTGSRDTGMLEQYGLGAGHAFDTAAEHSLDRGVIGIGIRQRAFDGYDLGDVWLIRRHPSADAGVEFVEMLDNQSAAGIFALWADPIKGKYQRIPELFDVVTKPERGGVRQVMARNQLRGY